MKLPEIKIPDLSAVLEQMKKIPPIRLAPGDKFIAQVDSFVVSAETQKAFNAFFMAWVEYLPTSLEMIEEVLSGMLEPMEPITEEEKNEVRQIMDQARSVRETITTTMADITPLRAPTTPNPSLNPNRGD